MNQETKLYDGFHVTICFVHGFKNISRVKRKEHAWSLWTMNITFDMEYLNMIDIGVNTFTKN